MKEPIVKKIKIYVKQTKVGKAKYKPRFNKTSVNVAECALCGDIVFSRTRHDLRSCSCNNTNVDGGFDYFKVSWQRTKPETYKLKIVQTKHQLYDDWNTMANKFGLITNENYKIYGVHSRGYGRATEGVLGRKGEKK